MTTFLISFLAFAAVVLIVLFAYRVWVNFFDPSNKAKRKRLKSIKSAVQWGGQSPSIAQINQNDSDLEIWLRSRYRVFVRLENLLHRARSPFSALRLLGIMSAVFILVVMLGLLVHTNLIVLFVLAVAFASSPLLWLSRQANKRRQAFSEKLPEALDYVTRSLRAGHSLTSAIGIVGKEFPGPIGQEFKIVFDEISFGIPFKEAMDRLADRVESVDLNFFVISLEIQHETGGNLTELLEGLAKTIRERFKLRGKIRTLSAEGRISALVLGCMPFILIGILTVINPEYTSVLWITPQGNTLLIVMAVLMALGFFSLNRISQIKV